jgi:hypothetical protein
VKVQPMGSECCRWLVEARQVHKQVATLLQVHSLDGGAEPDGGIVQDGSCVVMIARDQSDVCAVMVAENSHDRQLQCGARN